MFTPSPGICSHSTFNKKLITIDITYYISSRQFYFLLFERSHFFERIRVDLGTS